MLQLTTQRGLTLVELMIGVAILGFLLMIGIPSMSNWVITNRARSAADFYSEGFGMARREAVRHNARSRLVLLPNESNGQLDWRVDICFPTPAVACNNGSGAWSTAETAAAGDPEGEGGFKSVLRLADALPNTGVLVNSLVPAGSSTVYFTEVGWVDTTVDGNMTLLRLDPTSQYARDIPTVALAVTLSGIANKCDPTKSGADSRACPP